MQGEEKGFGDEDKTQYAQARCREVKGDMGQVRAKSGEIWCTMRQPRRKKVMVRKRENGERVTKNKKTTKKQKRSAAKKKEKKNAFFCFLRKTHLEPLTFPKGPKA